MLCAATVNHRFREILLSNPAQALATGYLEHVFSLTPEEQEFVLGIQAQQLEDFAAQVYCWIAARSHGDGCVAHDHIANGHNGHVTKGHNGDNRNEDGHPCDALTQNCMAILDTARVLACA